MREIELIIKTKALLFEHDGYYFIEFPDIKDNQKAEVTFE